VHASWWQCPQCAFSTLFAEKLPIRCVRVRRQKRRLLAERVVVPGSDACDNPEGGTRSPAAQGAEAVSAGDPGVALKFPSSKRRRSLPGNLCRTGAVQPAAPNQRKQTQPAHRPPVAQQKKPRPPQPSAVFQKENRPFLRPVFPPCCPPYQNRRLLNINPNLPASDATQSPRGPKPSLAALSNQSRVSNLSSTLGMENRSSVSTSYDIKTPQIEMRLAPFPALNGELSLRCRDAIRI